MNVWGMCKKRMEATLIKLKKSGITDDKGRKVVFDGGLTDDKYLLWWCNQK